MAGTCARIDFGLLSRLTDLLLCSRCLRQGRQTPVPQVVSHRHRPRSLCSACRDAERGGQDRPIRKFPASPVVSEY